MKPGDKVKIVTSDGEFEGVLLPRPALLSDDVTVLKLKTGYNIGIETKKIRKSSVLEEYKAPIVKQKKAVINKDLPTVAILSTGGTIASRVDYRTGGVVADYSADDFLAMCPELASIANVKAVKVMSMMSEDALAKDWERMALAVESVIGGVDGVVITHGTDTMHYSSAALSFILKGLNKPVIFTGAQRSIDRGSSDAFMNLVCAVIAASKWDGAEVAICMHSTMSDDSCFLLRGTKVRKMHTSRRDAFRPIGDEPLARVSTDGTVEVLNGSYRKRDATRPALRKCDSNIALVQVHPDMDPGIIDYYVSKKVKGIILAATALGHVPLNNSKSLELALKKASKAKMLLFVCTQTLYGRVHPYVYANLRRLSVGLGVHFLDDMLPEVAFAKLSVAIAQNDPVGFMLENSAGEFTKRELDDSFLR